MKHVDRSHLRYPGLWRGCVGAWAPSMGPSGTTLRDWSRHSNHGTLTNMDPAAAWAPSQGRHALSFDGTNDYVSCGMATFNPSQLSIQMWVRFNNFSQFHFLVTKTNGNYPATWDYYVSSGGSTRRFYAAAPVDSTINSLTTGVWYSLGVSFNGTTIKHYLNGQPAGSGTTYWPGSSAKEVKIGTRDDLYTYGNYAFDDVRIYDRELSVGEFAILATRRGIAYEPRQRHRRASVAVGGNRRRRVLIGAG